MYTAIAAVMGAQHGLVRRRQALDSGVCPADLDRLVRTRALVVVRRGVYTTAELWDSLDEHRGRPLLEARAASLNMTMPHLLSHESSALVLHLAILRPPQWLTHITRFGVLGCRTRHGVCHHKAPFEPWQILDPEGVPVLDRARTAVDIARERSGQDGLRHGLVACDSAMRAGTTRQEFERALAVMGCWPNVTVARACVDLADPGADNPAESLARLLVTQLGVGAVHTQTGFREGGRTAWADLRVRRHLIEVDGLVKYQRVENGGVADRDPGRVAWEEKRREDWLRRFRLGMTRLVWSDLMPSGWAAAQARVRHDIAETDRLCGRDVDDLAAYLVPGPRPRR